MRTKSAMLDRSRLSAKATTRVVDAGWLPCQNRMRRSATFFMAYSLQSIVAVDTDFSSGGAPLDEEKGRRALRRRPCPATAGSRGRFRCFHTLVDTPSI